MNTFNTLTILMSVSSFFMFYLVKQTLFVLLFNMKTADAVLVFVTLFSNFVQFKYLYFCDVTLL